MTKFTFPVEAGHALMFARALGEHGSEPISATAPTFLVAGAQFDPNYEMRPHPDRPWLGDNDAPPPPPGEEIFLAAERHFEFERAVKVGDILHAETKPGRQWTKPSGKGELRFSEQITTYHDENNALVATMRSVAVRLPEAMEKS